MTFLIHSVLTSLIPGLIAGAGNPLPVSALAQEASAETFQTICLPSEDPLFHGSVQDDFGLDVSICLKPARPQRYRQGEAQLSARWEGEGGGDSVTCFVSQCAGIIEYAHYVRPRFTEIRVAWKSGTGIQRLTETHDAQNRDHDPRSHVSHSWSPVPGASVPAERFAVQARTAPLSLLALMRYLPSQSLAKPLLTRGKGEE